jgi:hypothetical protein
MALRCRYLAAAASALLLSAGSPQAAPIATVYGEYDAGGIGDLPAGVISGLAWVNDIPQHDMPTLFFVNPSNAPITNAQMLLRGYGKGTYNDGLSQIVALGTIPADSVRQVSWIGPFSPGDLYSSDYDDQYVSNFGANPYGAPGSGTTGGDCTLDAANPGWFNYCAPVGNFTVTFTGQSGGQPVYAVFGETDLAGTYLGWEGVDPNGWSENALYDVHSGIVGGALANIVPGTPPVAEPMTLSLLASGLLGIVLARRRRRAH